MTEIGEAKKRERAFSGRSGRKSRSYMDGDKPLRKTQARAKGKYIKTDCKSAGMYDGRFSIEPKAGGKKRTLSIAVERVQG